LISIEVKLPIVVVINKAQFPSFKFFKMIQFQAEDDICFLFRLLAQD
jgi:hypothetical protein